MNLRNITLTMMIAGVSLIASTANADDVADVLDRDVYEVTVYATPAVEYEFPLVTIQDYLKKWQSGVSEFATSASQYKFSPITILDYVKNWQAQPAQ